MKREKCPRVSICKAIPDFRVVFCCPSSEPVINFITAKLDESD